MQKKKNIKLLILLIATLATSIGLRLAERSTSNLDIDKSFFQLDDQQEITDVYLQGLNLDNHFRFKDGRWYVNDSLRLDQSMRDVFFSVLSGMEVRRPVASTQKDSIVTFLTTKGVHTIITFGDEIIKDYWVGGNNNLEISWAMDSDEREPYQVHLPGYQSYLAGIFYVPTNDWRSRFVFNINFALIKAIELNYNNSPDDGFELEYNEGFFRISEMNADSTKIADFLDQIAFLQADRFLSKGEIRIQYDSLIKNNSLYARLLLEKSFGDSQEVLFYNRVDNAPFILAKTYDGAFCLFNYRRIKGIFKKRVDFE